MKELEVEPALKEVRTCPHNHKSYEVRPASAGGYIHDEKNYCPICGSELDIIEVNK